MILSRCCNANVKPNETEKTMRLPNVGNAVEKVRTYYICLTCGKPCMVKKIKEGRGQERGNA